jgi:hypothetical protein
VEGRRGSPAVAPRCAHSHSTPSLVLADSSPTVMAAAFKSVADAGPGALAPPPTPAVADLIDRWQDDGGSGAGTPLSTPPALAEALLRSLAAVPGGGLIPPGPRVKLLASGAVGGEATRLYVALLVLERLPAPRRALLGRAARLLGAASENARGPGAASLAALAAPALMPPLAAIGDEASAVLPASPRAAGAAAGVAEALVSNAAYLFFGGPLAANVGGLPGAPAAAARRAAATSAHLPPPPAGAAPPVGRMVSLTATLPGAGGAGAARAAVVALRADAARGGGGGGGRGRAPLSHANTALADADAVLRRTAAALGLPTSAADLDGPLLARRLREAAAVVGAGGRLVPAAGAGGGAARARSPEPSSSSASRLTIQPISPTRRARLLASAAAVGPGAVVGGGPPPPPPRAPSPRCPPPQPPMAGPGARPGPTRMDPGWAGLDRRLAT